MNKISDRRRLHSLVTPNHDDQTQLYRMATTSILSNQAPPSLDQMRKTIKQLQLSLKNERQLRIEAEENLKLHQTRTIFRERQFYKILQQSDQKVRSYVTSNQNSNIVKEIKKSYESILRNFQRTNQATTSMIESKYKQIISAMQRRIQTITSIMNEQVQKTKMMSCKNVNQIRKQIEQAIFLLKNVENQNLELKISIKKQKHKSKLLQQQRKLLLEEIVNKKFITVKLLEDNKRYRSKLQNRQENIMANKFSLEKQSKVLSRQKQPQHNKGSQENLDKINQKMLLNVFNHVQTKETTPQKQRFRSQNNSFTQKINKQMYNTTLAKSRFSQCTQKSKIRYQPNSRQDSCNLDKYVQKETNMAQINYKKKERKYTKRGMLSKNILCDDDNLLTLAKNNTINTESNSIQFKNNSQKIIEHLKISLQREKKKAYALGKIVTKIQNRNNQVNQAIMEALSQARSGGMNNRINMQVLLKSQKLLKIISDMKKRLSVCESPTVHCGWGQTEVDQFLLQTEDNLVRFQPNQSAIFS